MQHEPVRTTLTDAQRRDLAHLVDMPGYAVLKTIMDAECILQEANLLGVEASDEKKVLSEHRVAQAMWAFNTLIQNQIDHELALLDQHEQPEAKIETPEEGLL